MRQLKSLTWLVVLLTLLPLALAGCSKAKEMAPALVLERAYAATTEEVTSFHFTMSFAATVEGMEQIDGFGAEGGYLAPDGIRIRQTYGEKLMEMIVIGGETYIRDSESSLWRVGGDGSAMAAGFAGLVSPKHNLETLMDPGENVVQLEDQAMDGVECWRYEISIDPIQDATENMEEEADPEIKKMRREMVEMMREREMTGRLEMWIGKGDYLVRQFRSSMSQKALYDDEFGYPDVAIPVGALYTLTVTVRLSGFNEPVEIEAPTGPFR